MPESSRFFRAVSILKEIFSGNGRQRLTQETNQKEQYVFLSQAALGNCSFIIHWLAPIGIGLLYARELSFQMNLYDKHVKMEGI